MKWEEIAVQYPERYVLVEAITATSSNQLRRLEDMAVIQAFINSQEAWSAYKRMHTLHPARELYVFHTSRKDVEVKETFSGIVTALNKNQCLTETDF